MLSPDQAKARLAEWRLPEKENRLAEGVKRLPQSLRETAELAFDLLDDSQPPHLHSWQRRQIRLWHLANRLTSLQANDRAKLFNIVAPPLASMMEKTWQLLPTTPYQRGYT